MSTCFGCEIQTVYSCLNRTEITENRHQELKLNQNNPTVPMAISRALKRALVFL